MLVEPGRPRTSVRCSLTTEDASSERATVEGVGRAKPRGTKRAIGGGKNERFQ
jgi:hypothetical protein